MVTHAFCASPGAAPPLDHEVILQLRALDGDAAEPGFLAELVETFIKDARTRMVELETLLKGDDRARATRVAHYLKGGAGGMGAIPLSRLFGHVETGCRDDDPPRALEALMVEIRAEFERVRGLLEAEVGGSSG